MTQQESRFVGLRTRLILRFTVATLILFCILFVVFQAFVVKGIVSEVERTVQQALSATDLDPGVKADLTDQFTASARSTALQFGGRDLLVLFGLFSVLTLAVNMLVVNSVTGNIQRLTAAVQGISI
jgi:hypothetical protein